MNKVTKDQFEQLKRLLRQSGNRDQCPVWPNCKARLPESSGFTAFRALRSVWSPRAGGVFMIPDRVPPSRIEAPGEETRKRVSSWIWERNAAFDALDDEEEAELPVLTQDSIQELAGRKPLPAEQRIDRALHAIGRPPACLASREKDDIQVFQAATGCGEHPQEMKWLLKELESASLARNTSGDNLKFSYMLTLAGLNRLETGGEAEVSNTAFVAMWFNPEVDGAYQKGIEPAITEAGYEPMRIDRKEHSNRIDDEIVAEIRRARFLICDFTCGLLEDGQAESGKTAVARGGVYYEAGLAHGLGKRVIWTCRSDLICHVHFDLRQYNIIRWKTGKEDELRKALLNRIRAEIV